MRLEYFEMIDRVTSLDRETKRIEASSTVPQESPVFEGHFPGHPLVPGVLLTETMAQASGSGWSGPAIHGRAFAEARGSASQALRLTLRRQAD